MSDTILVIDDEPELGRIMSEYFAKLGYEVFEDVTAEAGLETYDRMHPSVVILDLQLPGMGGLEALERLKGKDAAVVLLTGNADVPTAVRAMQLGAENFLTKPMEMPHLAAVVARVAEKVRLKRQVGLMRAADGGREGLDALGASAPMRELERQIRLLAESDQTTVLLTGESGTGKGWVARLIHRLSPRTGGPFVEVNAAGLQPTFLNSELFGHEKGAFTDAKDRKLGLFELADGGSMFLDEIGDLSPELQPKLLHVLETKTFRRLGGTKELTVNVRLITATNRDLSGAVAGGNFREDLFYRLNVLPIHLPPVRDRSREDRLALLTHILADLRVRMPGSAGVVTDEALERLLAAQWSGNVREMRNVLERAMIMSRGAAAIGLEHLPADFRLRGGAGGDRRRYLAQSLDQVERTHIERTLQFHSGNRTRAAKELGISRATLINKIREYGLNL